MRVLIVYESLWGNTEKVARTLASELSRTMEVDVRDVDAAPNTVEGYDLLVVGGPTHGFSMTRESTREGAVTQHGAPHRPAKGIREWLNELTPTQAHIKAVAFDTRVVTPRLPGSAARAAKQELRSLGFDIPVKQKTFRVHGYEGPLADGELEKATEWARDLASTLSDQLTR